MTSGPWSWQNMGLGNATPMASFYWLCALSSELIVTNTMFKQKDERKTRLKSDWWERKAVELQRAAYRNTIKGFSIMD